MCVSLTETREHGKPENPVIFFLDQKKTHNVHDINEVVHNNILGRILEWLSISCRAKQNLGLPQVDLPPKHWGP